MSNLNQIRNKNHMKTAIKTRKISLIVFVILASIAGFLIANNVQAASLSVSATSSLPYNTAAPFSATVTDDTGVVVEGATVTF